MIKMKTFRLLTSIILLFFTTVSLLPAAITTTSKWVDIQGVYGETLSLEVTPIAAQTLSYISGMPFNILDNQVNPQQGAGGRRIADFSAASNTLFTIEVTATSMHPTGQNSPLLDYILTFSFDVSTPAGSYTDEQFSVESSAAGNTYEYLIASDLESVGDGFIGILDGGIFFHFTGKGWETANSTAAPDGEYEATVKIALKGR